jgi:hypothetical protein
MSRPPFKFEKEDLLEEKSLLDVYRIARLTPPNPLNVAVTLVVFFGCCVYVVVAGEHQIPVLGLLRAVSSDAIAFTTSILGFLVAGFTIFVTTNPQVFYLMARHEKDTTRVSYLKHNLALFLLVFIHYLTFTVLCVTLRVFFASNGPAAFFLATVPVAAKTLATIKDVGIAVTFVVFVTWLFYLLMLLKSFIFNVYHIVMTGIALTIEEDD